MITKLLSNNTALKSLIVFAFFIFSTSLFSQNEFITTWKTDNPGTSTDTSITIPTTGAGYSYDVDWTYDGVTFNAEDSGVSGNITHDYGAAGTYIVAIRGDFPRIYFNNTGDKQKIISIDQWGTIAWTSMENAFRGTSNLVGNTTDIPDLSGVTNMKRMFNNATVFNQDISLWNVGNVTVFEYMFDNASTYNNGGLPLNWNIIGLTSLARLFSGATAFNQDISAWDTSEVTNMSYMFFAASSFNQNISGWDTSAVTNMAGMFNTASVFNQNISAWDTSAVTYMIGMFSSATGFNQDISAWDTSKVTNMSYMFSSATEFNQDLSGWNTILVTTMSNMFDGAVAFNQDISNWDTSKVTYLSYLFRGAEVFNQDISAWDTSAVIDMSFMFADAIVYNNAGQPLNFNTTSVVSMTGMFGGALVFNQDISSWDISLVEGMGAMFNGATAFNNGGQLLDWDTSSVLSMGNMFSGASAFNQDISSWNVGNVAYFAWMFDGASTYNNDGVPLNWNTTGSTNLQRLFSGAPAFNQDISSWDVSSVINMHRLFENATSFNNGGLPLNWNPSAVTSMQEMFKETTVFNQDISSWDVGNVSNFNNMFDGASSYNNGGQPLNWDTTGLNNFSGMFRNATAFNQDIGGWNTSVVTSMSQMFSNATSFNQNIGGWNVESVTNFGQMFSGITLSDANYDALLIGWDAQNLSPSEAFDAGNSQYCSPAAQAARAHMIDAVNIGGDGWTITDGGQFAGTCGQLGLEDNEIDSILLYPNPTKGNITITLKSSASYSLVNMLGQEIQKGTFAFGDNTLDISNFTNGLYFLNVKTSQGTATKKIMKQ